MSQPTKNSIETRLEHILEDRRRENSYRSLQLSHVLKQEDDEQQEVRHHYSNRSSACHEAYDDDSCSESPNGRHEEKKCGLMDFCSNDYLGLAHSAAQHDLVQTNFHSYTANLPQLHLGSSGSRLLSGNSSLCVELERFLASIHCRPAALVCNSGYDANLSILSSLLLVQDIVILDELCHNSLIMGVKMSRIRPESVWYFRHNNMEHLQTMLSRAQQKCRNHNGPMSGNIFVVVESVYSMDGDVSPLQEVLNLSLEYHAHVIVDEAHGLGVYGRTNPHCLVVSSTAGDTHDDHDACDGKLWNGTCIDCSKGGTGVLAALGLENHPALLAAVFTFGKAAGCHGAVITGSRILMEYLVNYARPFIYSTSLPPHSLVTIKCAYDTMTSKMGEEQRKHVFYLVWLFRSSILRGLRRSGHKEDILLPSPSPIQAILCSGNHHCMNVANMLRSQGGIAVFAIRSPTVPKGQERIRIILHSHNTKDEVEHLVQCLLQFACTRRTDHRDDIRTSSPQMEQIIMAKL